MDVRGPVSHLPPFCGSQNSQGSGVTTWQHYSVDICAMRCALDPSWPKSTGSCLGPTFSLLPYQEGVAPYRLVVFSEFLSLS